MNLEEIAKEINDLLEIRRQEIGLTFEEENHTYTMADLEGVLVDTFPSVSKVIKEFYKEFDAEKKSLEKSKGDPAAQAILLSEWKASGDYATNMGSRVHFLLEIETLKKFKRDKTVRKPHFECDEVQTTKGDSMVKAGITFLETMEKRGAVLLDTEIVLGDPELGYTGQPDKKWLMLNADGDLGIVVTDWKTNAKKNFEPQWYTDKMYEPFEYLDNTALGHYFIQLPLYAKLLLKMLKGTKYEHIKFFGAIVVLLKEDGSFEEYRVPKKVSDTILKMDIQQYLK
jgi:hypothetical protein